MNVDKDVARYREQAELFRKQAAQAMSDQEREDCLTLATGFERLIEIITGFKTSL